MRLYFRLEGRWITIRRKAMCKQKLPEYSRARNKTGKDVNPKTTKIVNVKSECFQNMEGKKEPIQQDRMNIFKNRTYCTDD